MASFYGWANHWEDVAETHCYLARHGNNVGFLKGRDNTLYKKCQIFQQFAKGEDIRGEQFAKSMEGPGTVFDVREDR